MSTRSVLTIVGQYIGGMYGGTFGAAIGGMIGGAIGGAIDPETIQGPKLGDAQIQTSRDGVPRPIVYGIGPIVGNLIDRSDLSIVTVGERQGKAGTTPVVEHDEAYMTYAIRICEGPIVGIRRIWEDEKLVLDQTAALDRGDFDTEEEYHNFFGIFVKSQATSTKFLSNKRIYLGDEDQLPDSALEAIHGVGNVPAYRGTAYMVFEHENLTKKGGAIPTYRFEVVGRGNATSRTADTYDVKQMSGFRKAHWPLLDDEANYTMTGTRFSTDYSPLSGLTGDTVDEIIAQAAIYPGGELPTEYYGYAARDELTYGFDMTGETYDPTDVDSVYLIYNAPRDVAGYLTYEAYGGGGTICGATTSGEWLVDKRGAIVTKATQAGFVYPGPEETFQDCSATVVVVGYYPLVIKATRKKYCTGDGGFGLPRAHRLPVLLPDASDFTFDFDTGEVASVPVATTVTGTFHVLQNEVTATPTWGTTYTKYDVGPAIPNTDSRYNSQDYWEYVYALAVADGKMASGLVYGVDYPVIKTSVCRLRSTYNEVQADGLYLYEIVDDVCDRVGIGADERDTSELTDVVLGYVCARQMNGAEAIRATQGAYVYDMPEFDAKIRGVKRGAAAVVTFDEDDLVWLGDDTPTELLVRDQSVEYPRKVHVISYDPITAYVPTKETAERSSANVESVSEVTLQLALTIEHDERKQIADRTLKIAWAEAQGTVEISVPDYLSKYTASDVFLYGGRRYRIDRVQTFDGYQTLECRADRQSAYTSTLTGTAPLDPSTPPLGALAGPTMLSVLNIPAQQESDEVAGVYVAVAGVLTGWAGAMLQVSTDNGATWTNVQAIRTQTPQGALTTPLADETNSPSDNDFGVRVYGGDLESATASQVALGANRAAVSNDDGQTWEILSFETATETADHEFTLSELERGLDGTTPQDCGIGDLFCMLSPLTFVPLSEDLDGQTILFRAVTLGTLEDNTPSVSIVFHLQDVIWDGGAP